MIVLCITAILAVACVPGNIGAADSGKSEAFFFPTFEERSLRSLDSPGNTGRHPGVGPVDLSGTDFGWGGSCIY
jgi:hypothetical protein